MRNFIAAFITYLAAAADADVLSGVVTLDGAFDDASDAQKLEVTFVPTLEFDVGNVAVTAIGRFRYDFKSYIDVDEHSVDAELRELYVDFNLADAFVRLGKQQVVWGQADGLKVLDVVNPQSFREFILDEFEESRIPLWTVNVEVPVGAGTLQLLYIPDLTYHELPDRGSLFAFTAPFADLPTGVPVTITKSDRPDNRWRDADAGMRYTAFKGGWDLSFNYFYAYDDLPVIRQSVTAEGLTLTPGYERSHLLGGTASNVFGDYTLRLEWGLARGRYFRAVTNDGVAKSQELSSVVGVDWSGISDTLVSAQFFQSSLLDHDNTFDRSQTEMSATFLFRRTFLNQTLNAEVLVIQSLSGDGAVIRPKLAIDYWTNVAVELYADLFEGEPEDLFGQFDDRDRMGVTVTISL